MFIIECIPFSLALWGLQFNLPRHVCNCYVSLIFSISFPTLFFYVSFIFGEIYTGKMQKKTNIVAVTMTTMLMTTIITRENMTILWYSRHINLNIAIELKWKLESNFRNYGCCCSKEVQKKLNKHRQLFSCTNWKIYIRMYDVLFRSNESRRKISRQRPWQEFVNEQKRMQRIMRKINWKEKKTKQNHHYEKENENADEFI